MPTQFDKCADVRNHGHNNIMNMGCEHAPQGGMPAQGHTFTFSNLSVCHGGNCSVFTAWHYESSIIAHRIVIAKYKHPNSSSTLVKVACSDFPYTSFSNRCDVCVMIITVSHKWQRLMY